MLNYVNIMGYKDKQEQSKYMREYMKAKRDKLKQSKCNNETQVELKTDAQTQTNPQLETKIEAQTNNYYLLNWNNKFIRVMRQLKKKSILPKHIFEMRIILKQMLVEVFDEIPINYEKTELIMR